ncbi:MAG: hypothetical protein EOP51_28670 [Sphingobacteriales bacterium]|nr:MAG: hypothetical protein EOP51_28670 [Sphingobacteriales bacterium]
MIINAAIFWKQTNNAIIEYTETNVKGISITSKQNLAANKQYGLNLSASIKPNAKWSINGNTNINNLNFNSGALQIFKEGWAADFNLNTTYKLPAGYAVQAFGDYNTRQVTLQGFETSRYYYSFGVKKEIPAKQLTLTLMAVNPFTESINQRVILNGAGFESTSNNSYYNRAVKLTIGWEFGKLFDKKERKKINNDDVKGMDKG